MLVMREEGRGRRGMQVEFGFFFFFVSLQSYYGRLQVRS